MTQGCHTSPVWCGCQGRLSPGRVGTRQVSLFATPFLSLFTASGSESVVFTPVRSHTFSCLVQLRQRPALQKHAPGIRAHAQAGPRIWETLSQLPACWTPPPRLLLHNLQRPTAGLPRQDVSLLNTQNSTGKESHQGPLFSAHHHPPGLEQKMEWDSPAIWGVSCDWLILWHVWHHQPPHAEQPPGKGRI